MSLRSITRCPKRMLVFFEEDGNTSILSTNRVKKIIRGGNKVENGAVVVVDYENVDYEAVVIKLHDDPTVLSKCEADFLKTLQLQDQDDDNVVVAEVVANKENNPQPVAPVAKRPKLALKAKEGKARKPKDNHKAKARKIISIDAEITPTDSFSSSKAIEQLPSKNQNQPGSLNFLDIAEQVRVQKLLSDFVKGRGEEIATQTEPLSEEKIDSIAVAPKDVETKYVQTEPEASVPSCHCKDIAASLELLHEKIEFIYAKSLQVSQPTESQPHRWSEPYNSIPSEESANQDDVLGNDSVLASHAADVLPILSPPSRSFLPESELQELQPICSSSPGIRSAIFEETFKESSSMANYAKNIVFKVFARHELDGSNCAGVKGKRSLENDQRMHLVKDATFRKYCVEDKKKSWASCRKAIDCAIRHLKPLQ